MRLSRLVVVAVAFGLVLLHTSSHATAWGEDNLTTNPELSNQNGINDSTGTASEDIRLNSLPNSGVAAIANDSDNDYYRLAGYSSGSNEFLKVTTDGTRVYLRLREDGGSQIATASLGSDMYYLLPSSSTNYFLEANRGGDTHYRVTMEKVSSATITGQLQFIGLVDSTSNSCNVIAYDQAGNEVSRTWVSDPNGNYSISVPANIPIYALGASRTQYEYFGVPPFPSDWFYGLSYHLLPAPITLAGGGSSNNNHFKVYPSAVITGTITPSVNVTLDIYDMYSRESVAYDSNTQNAFSFYNVPPGTYNLLIKPNSPGYAPYLLRNIRPVDGQTLNVNVNLTSGYTVSGIISPAPAGDTVLQLNKAGSGQIGGDGAFDRHLSVAISAGQSAYAINNVPNGSYDMVLGNEGPTSYPIMPITVNNSSLPNSDIITNFDGIITGTVTNQTALYPDLTQLMIVGVTKGQTAPAYTSMFFGPIVGPVVNSTAAFAIGVPDYNSHYDLFVADFNSAYPILGRTYDVVTGTATAAITIEANGNSIYGTMAHSSGKTLESFLNETPFLMVTKSVGGIHRMVDLIIDTSSDYSTGPFIDGAPNTPYSVAINGYSPFMFDTTTNLNMVGNNEQADLTFLTNPAEDSASVSIVNLEPRQNQVTTNPRPLITASFWDKFLGTGVNVGAISVLLNGVPVSVVPSLGPEGSYHIEFQPASDLLYTNNPQTVAITAADFSTNPTIVPTANVMWSFDIATPAPSFTPTTTATQTPVFTSTNTPTITLTSTITMTSTISPTLTPSASITFTPTYTSTATESATYTTTPTNSPTYTETSTLTPSATLTNSATYTATSTATPTSTPTTTVTATPTATHSATYTSTSTITMTSTTTPTSTISATATHTPDNPLIGVDLGKEITIAYPNPAKDKVDFLFHIQDSTLVRIEIYNMQGERLSTITKQFSVGEGQTLSWQAADVGPGVYMARIFVNGKHKLTKKIAITK